MAREIHFYEYYKSIAYHSWITTQEQIENGKNIIHTTQMGLLNTRLFELGYRIFIHEYELEYYEIVLGSGNERTNREIKMGHNLFKMWQSGEFMRY